MGAVRTTAVGALRRRRLQAFVIGFVLALATGAATLAGAILVESDAPFDRAFAAANGAHLAISYGGATSPAALAATTAAGPVTAAVGPWPVGRAGLLVRPPGGRPGATGVVPGAAISGRSDPGGNVDRIALLSGRWWQQPGEIVLHSSRDLFTGLSVGDTIQVIPSVAGKSDPAPGPGGVGTPTGAALPPRTMTIVGFAQSISTPDVLAWMSPADLAALQPAGSTPDLQMLYRVEPGATADDLQKAAAAITANVPSADVHATATDLALRERVNRTADLMVPILLAFSLFALLAAAFSIVNVVSGVVLASYRDIGILKAVGFTPGQVTAMLLFEILVPVVIGAIVGITIGTLASQPTIASTAQAFGLPTGVAVSGEVVVVVAGLAILVAVLAALGPAWRAGRLTATTVLTRGLAPSGNAIARRLRGAALRVRVADPARIGLARAAARPLRAAMTLGALAVGVAALVFTIGMTGSLRQVGEDIDRDHAAPIQIELPPNADPTSDAATVTAAIAANPDTWHVTAIADASISVPGLSAPVPYIAYDGDSSTIGYSLIAGRWFAGPGEVVAPTNFLRQSGLTVGSSFTATFKGSPVQLTVVGEVFDIADEARDDVLVRGSWASLATVDPSLAPSRWEIAPRSGVDPVAYRDALREALGRTADVQLTTSADSDTGFLLFEGVVFLLGVVLVAMSIGGVFNTILLDSRERIRDTAILKAIGMTPRQTMAMVLSSIVPAGLLAGCIGIPIGILLQRAALSQMAAISAQTNLPPDVLNVFAPVALVVVALSGLAIGGLGALLPARRAARSPIAPVLQAE